MTATGWDDRSVFTCEVNLIPSSYCVGVLLGHRLRTVHPSQGLVPSGDLPAFFLLPE